MAVIHLVGAPGAGKTTVRDALAIALGIKGIGIDDIRASLRQPHEPEWPPMHENLAWWRLGRAIRARNHSIVETYGTNRREERLFTGLRVLTVLVDCDSMTRYRRLRNRTPGRLDDLIAVPAPAVPYDLWWDGAVDPHGPTWDALVGRIRTFLDTPIRYAA